ncbi:hypothetical protein PLESTB_000173300 [Pleodorina starrii]|uniref:Uncharacterized protein n=1 Tax=Pleodorina starrii TaxID=330485 RepID=A0A9W6BBC7_9CHLO|nr:hypothetical protein PLESTM_000523500 [Pleodorina starrii]GLC49016.1 hypothetical protein PLESTB_000173300 [Pleodorina starrii]GLC66189.1 hypothetical protein PLESTF_000394600 [Pleodorina starrii]
MPLNAVLGHHIRPAVSRSFDNSPRSTSHAVELAFPERSPLWQCPEEVQWEVHDNALSDGPTLSDTYGSCPSDYVVSAIRYGPAGVATASITTVTNKAVISALLLTFNYGAVSTAAQTPDSSDLFRAYFFCQMTSVVLAFCVMLSAATFTSHVSRCGQHSATLIAYLRGAHWIDVHLNEPLFVAQCLATVLALVLNVVLTYSDSFILFSLVAMVVVSTALLAAAHIRSRRILNQLAQHDWRQITEAEKEFRCVLAARSRQRRNSGASACDAEGNGVAAGAAAASEELRERTQSDGCVGLICADPRDGGDGDVSGDAGGGNGGNGGGAATAAAAAPCHLGRRLRVRAGATTEPEAGEEAGARCGGPAAGGGGSGDLGSLTAVGT